jgi:hypothetical protein
MLLSAAVCLACSGYTVVCLLKINQLGASYPKHNIFGCRTNNVLMTVQVIMYDVSEQHTYNCLI